MQSDRIEVRADRLLYNWGDAYRRALGYLRALHWRGGQHAAVAGEAVRAAVRLSEGGAMAGVMRSLRAILRSEHAPGTVPASGAAGPDFRAWRLLSVLGDVSAGRGAGPVADPVPRLPVVPPLQRSPMCPEPAGRRAQAAAPGAGAPLYGRELRRMRRELPWTRVALRRRAVFGVLVLAPTLLAASFMADVLPHRGGNWLEITIVLFFGALFGWISIGFWTALLGCWTLLRGDGFAITRLPVQPDEPIDPEARTAVLMPICEEPVERVFAGLRAIERSLARTGRLDRFDFFVLSDSKECSTAVREEEAWFSWCRDVGGFGRIFYRRRKVRIERKSGNVADFCRRWGAKYRYMIMLDADSLMAGDTLVRLVQFMERRPQAGMIQTAPVSVNRHSLFARVQQFASRLYGPIFATGLHYWQLGDGQYWGHNAIIRVKPFMDHCALPRLPGKPPLGGEILSHDFVEAALMGRAGWNLWLAYDLPGSYEEAPSTLLEEMNRDRRWCQGNLQHLRLLRTEGLFGAHRALFLNGALSYVSALLWFSFLVLSTVEAVSDVFWPPDYFPHGESLFPEWPVWQPARALLLVAVTATVLFLPKILSLILVFSRSAESRRFGGRAALVASVFLETILSSLLAPIRMVFHSRFVIQNLLGRTVSWRSLGRADVETTWSAAVRYHGTDALVATLWGAGLLWLNPYYFWWILPVIGALVLSVPLSVLASRTSIGKAARRRGLFVIPEEHELPAELRDLQEIQGKLERERAELPAAEKDGFVRAVVDPCVNAVHCAVHPKGPSLKPSISAARDALVEKALRAGPDSLREEERRVLLGDPQRMTVLHDRAWELDGGPARLWGRPGE